MEPLGEFMVGAGGGAGRAMVGAWWEPDFLPNKDERRCFVKRLEDCPTSPQGSKTSPGQWMRKEALSRGRNYFNSETFPASIQFFCLLCSITWCTDIYVKVTRGGRFKATGHQKYILKLFSPLLFQSFGIYEGARGKKAT